MKLQRVRRRINISVARLVPSTCSVDYYYITDRYTSTVSRIGAPEAYLPKNARKSSIRKPADDEFSTGISLLIGVKMSDGVKEVNFGESYLSTTWLPSPVDLPCLTRGMECVSCDGTR